MPYPGSGWLKAMTMTMESNSASILQPTLLYSTHLILHIKASFKIHALGFSEEPKPHNQFLCENKYIK